MDNERSHPSSFFIFFIALAFVSSILYAVLSPLLTSELITGWDFIAQYYLVDKMSTYVEQGTYRGYDEGWFAGVPLFTFYGFFPYLSVVVLQILAKNFIEITLVHTFNIIVFTLPFLTLFAMTLLTRVSFGKGFGVSTLFISLIVLIKSGMSHYAPVNIYSSLLHGHFASFFTFFILILLLSTLTLQFRKKSLLYRILSIAFTLIIIFSHVITALFTAVLFIGIFLFSSRKIRQEVFIVGFFSLFLSSFWWFPFLRDLWMTSGSEIHLRGVNSLQLFMPEGYKIRDCFNYISRDIFFGFPLPGILFFLSLAYGIRSLIVENKYFLPLSFISLLFVLPSYFLPTFFSLPIHYYRFVLPLFAFAVPLASYGLRTSFRSIYNVQSYKVTVRIFMFFILFLTVFQVTILNYDFNKDYSSFYAKLFLKASSSCKGKHFENPIKPLVKMRGYQDLNELIQFVAYTKPQGRVIAEVNPEDARRLGSPHAIATLLALQHNIATLPGLLAESSISSSFIIPTLAYGSDSTLWGSTTLYERSESIDPYANPLFDLSDMLERLRLYGTEMIIASSLRYSEALQEEKAVDLIFQAGPYSVFQFKEVKQYYQESDYKPFLYIERGGPDFRTFSEEWFKEDSLIDYPVIYTRQKYESLSSGQKEQIGGLIFSYRENWIRLSDKELEKIQSYNKPVILLNKRNRYYGIEIPELNYIGYFGRNLAEAQNGGLLELASLLRYYTKKKPVWNDIDSISDFRSKGVVARYSYHPSWRKEEYIEEMFLVTPSFIYLPASDANEK